MFLDFNKPIKTCSQSSCQDCPLLDSLHCHFKGIDLVKFLAVVFPAFVIGSIGIYRFGIWFFIPWIALIFFWTEGWMTSRSAKRQRV